MLVSYYYYYEIMSVVTVFSIHTTHGVVYDSNVSVSGSPENCC